MRYAFPRLLILLTFGYLAAGSEPLRAGETFEFPRDHPAFTFDLPDNMQAEYQADGTLACTAKDGSLNIKGVFQPLPKVKNDKDLAFGLNGLIKQLAPQFISTDLRYFEPFSKDTPSGLHTFTVGAQGRRNGQDFLLGFIVISQAGRYYELIISGDPTAMTSCNFPHAVRETAKPIP